LRRNMAQSLIEHETISTTIQKAKEVKPFVEKLITLAKKGKLEHRRLAISLLGNRDIIAIEEGEATRKGTVVGKLFSDLGPRYLNRSGGYTRIIRLAQRRLGDNGQLVLLQLLGADEPVKREGRVSTKRGADRKRKETARAKAAKEASKAAKQEQKAAEQAVAEAPEAPKEAPEAGKA
jgi:large subunit ribosomal protein L17